jgi:hypothetical protein
VAETDDRVGAGVDVAERGRMADTGVLVLSSQA